MTSRRLISAVLLTAYGSALMKLLVFKISLLNVGRLRFRFAAESGDANLQPFKSIWRCLQGEPRWSIAILNLVGNVVLFVPIGLLLPLVFPRLTWRRSLIAAIACGVAVEGTQALFRLGIFDIDDVMLNALGVMVGYSAIAFATRPAHPSGA